jgi:hypothetical protein
MSVVLGGVDGQECPSYFWGLDWGFAEFAGDFADVAGDGVAWESLSESGFDLESEGFGDFEVCGAGDAIELVKVIRKDSEVDQFEAEFFEDLGGVIDLAEEDGLVEYGDPGFDELSESGGAVSGDFLGMVGVYDEDGLQGE